MYHVLYCVNQDMIRHVNFVILLWEYEINDFEVQIKYNLYKIYNLQFHYNIICFKFHMVGSFIR